LYFVKLNGFAKKKKISKNRKRRRNSIEKSEYQNLEKRYSAFTLRTCLNLLSVLLIIPLYLAEMNTKSTSDKLIHLASRCIATNTFVFLYVSNIHPKKKSSDSPVKINTVCALVIHNELRK
jgi:hypothetical protein